MRASPVPPLWTVLPGFVSTGEQEHDPVAFLGEVDAVAGTEEEMQFIDALTSYQSLYPIRYSNTNAVLKTSSTLQCVLGYGLYRIRRKTGPIWISRPCLLSCFLDDVTRPAGFARTVPEPVALLAPAGWRASAAGSARCWSARCTASRPCACFPHDATGRRP